MSVNHRIEYIPLTKDLNGNHLIYPIYIPINIDEPEIFAATGKLSPHDYKRTLKLLHSRPMFKVDDKGAGQVEEAGFPFAPLIAALAPIVIPGVIKAAKNIFGKKSNSSKGRLYMGRGEAYEASTADAEVFDIDDAYDASETEDLESKPAKASDIPSISSTDNSEEIESSGYIPTNPNINSLRKLQSLYDKYD